MSDCVICRGSKRVKLPVYSRASARYEAAPISMAAIDDSYRTYECPECVGSQAAEEKVSILYGETSFQIHSGIEEWKMKEAAMKQLAHATADKILRDGLMEIHQEPQGDRISYRSRIGVVSPRAVSKIERRAFDKMKELLRGACAKASDAIAVWGSAYTGNDGMISKGQAIDYVQASFDRHIAETEQML